MLVRLAVVDFDGTLTDEEQEGEPFRAAFFQDVASYLAVTLEEVEAFAQRVEPLLNPQTDVWMRCGFAVAAATTDPFLRCSRIARQLIQESYPNLTADEVERVLVQMFLENYPKAGVCFREGAEDLVTWMLERQSIVATNSDPAAVREKLNNVARGQYLTDRVRGFARKYDITPREPAGIPDSLSVPGLESRRVLLRRGHYYHIICEARGTPQAADLRDVLVIGNNFELDLAMPLALGAHAILMSGTHTPDYERAYIAAHPRGHVVASIPELMPLLRERYGA